MVRKKRLNLVNILFISILFVGVMLFLALAPQRSLTGAVVSIDFPADAPEESLPDASSEISVPSDAVSDAPEAELPEDDTSGDADVPENITLPPENNPVEDLITEPAEKNESIELPSVDDPSQVLADNLLDTAAVTTQDISIASVPVLSSLVLNTTNLETNDTTTNLTAYNVSNTATKVIYNWLRNSSSIMIANMPFERINYTNTTNAWDYSGYGNNGSDQGSIVWNDTGGYDGLGAYEFDGIDDQINIPYQGTHYTPRRTITLWAKHPSISSVVGIISNDDLGGSRQFTISAESAGNSLTFRIWNTTASTDACAIASSPNTWHFYAMTNNGTHVIGRVDGTTCIKAINGDLKVLAQPIKIGSGATSSRYWNGTIDDVRIFNRTLSNEQILAIFNNRSDLIVAEETQRFENWTVIGYPNNGTGDGALVISSVNILNARPTQGTPILNTTNVTLNDTNQNLTLYLQNVADIDGDAVKNITNWLRNGIPIAVLNMPFEGINSTNVNNSWDYSGLGNSGTEFGNPIWNSTGGFDGKGAYYFDNASTQYLNIPDTNYLDFNTTTELFTISFWAKHNCPNNANPACTGSIYDTMLAKGTFGTCTENYAFFMGGSGISQFVVYNGSGCSGGFTTNGNAWPNNTWMHVVGKYNGTHIVQYENGVKTSSIATPTPPRSTAT
ncbi:MAG: LamG domain-containing protein, partial [Nanoarchaeota archaeon]